jgi:hypothetical protein
VFDRERSIVVMAESADKSTLWYNGILFRYGTRIICGSFGLCIMILSVSGRHIGCDAAC